MPTEAFFAGMAGTGMMGMDGMMGDASDEGEGENDDGCCRFDIYYTTGTVKTCLDHPRQGRTQMFRRNVDLAGLRRLFQSPRQHTGKGYQKRRRR